MKKLILVLILANLVLQINSSVFLPFEDDMLVRSLQLTVSCYVKNEIFQGWYRDATGSRVATVSSWNDVKDQPAVVLEAGFSPGEKNYVLVFPRGSLPSLGGKYTCKGDSSQKTATIYAPFNLNKLQTSQTLSAGKAGKIVLGAMSYPPSKFTWKKDNVPLDFSGGRLKLEKDGSIALSNVLNADGGDYEVQINWTNRRTVDIKIKVKVSDK